MTIYNTIGWVNDSPPAINASNLNYMDEGIQNAHIEINVNSAAIGSVAAYASTLYDNISANASAIAYYASVLYEVQSTQGAHATALVDLNALVAAQTDAIASNTAGVASLIPAVNGQSSQIADLYATQGAHASIIAEIVATQAYLDSQFADIIATQTSLVVAANAYASTLALHATQIYDLQQSSPGGGGGAVLVFNRSGLGPVDLWNESAPVGVTATSTVPRAIGLKYTPPGELILATGLAEMSFELLANAGVASPTRDFSVSVVGPTGVVLAWSSPTSVPSVATGAIVQTVTVPLEVAGATAVLDPAAAYYCVLASDDFYRFSVLGQDDLGEAAGRVRWTRGLAYEWDLPSGLNLGSYGSLPLSQASSFPPEGYPATFLLPA